MAEYTSGRTAAESAMWLGDGTRELMMSQAARKRVYPMAVTSDPNEAQPAAAASATRLSNHVTETTYTQPLCPTDGDDQVQTGDATQAHLYRLHSVVAELFRALSESLHDEPGTAAECLQRAEAMLDGRHEDEVRTAATAVRQGLAPWQVRRVVTYIDANLDTSIKNKDLAAIARLSVFHFNVAFRNSVGHSPHEYIIQRRMERAQGLMLSTEMPLSEIAAECGLADQAHLTRLFHRVVGESPAAWRRARANPRP